MKTTRVYERNNNGNVVKETTTQTTDGVSVITTKEYTYDDFGNVLTETVIEIEGKPAEPVTQDEPEPILLYCVDDHFPGCKLTKGKTYTLDADGCVTYDSGVKGFRHASFEDYKRDCPVLADCLVPLVKRPAKVGEWVYIKEDNGGAVTAGSIWKVDKIAENYGLKLVGCWFCRHDNYLVLDGYQPEPPKCEHCGQELPQK